MQSADTQAETPNGPSAATAVPLDSQHREQRIFDPVPRSSSETRAQQEIEKNESSGQGGASAYDESPSRSTDDDSSPLEARASGVVEPSRTSTTSGHSMSTSLSQARSREEVENYESGVRQRAASAAANANSGVGRSATSPGAMRQEDDQHALGSAVSHSPSTSSSPSRRSLMLLDGAIVMLLVWAGALVTRKLF